jgi:uncharacterized protein
MPVEPAEIRAEYADGSQVNSCVPPGNERIRGMAIWIPFLGGNRDTCNEQLIASAERGFVAISLDPWGHGERATRGKPGIRARASRDFRAVMWQIIGLTALDAYRVIDWAIEEYGDPKSIVVGGLSMGGDIGLSLAGIDGRVSKVACIGSSPDWEREGMTDVVDPAKIIDQGHPTAFGSWLCSRLNPMANIEKYRRRIDIQLEYGKMDSHIHAEWGRSFKDQVERARAPARIEIICEEDAGHISLLRRKAALRRALDFLLA